jgi:uncharacterized delta-60 repeat protein
MGWSGGWCLLGVLLAWPASTLAQSASGFDATGITTIRIGARPVDEVSSAVRLASGHVLLAGTFNTGTSQAFLARLRPDGTPDPGFGTGGVATLPAPSFASGVAAHPAGGAVLLATTGLSTAQLAVARFTETGTLDPGYGGGGIGTATIPDLLGVSGVAVSATGRAFVAGTAGDPARAVVLRFDAAGNLDPTYGTAGVAMGGPDSSMTSLVVTAAGVAFGAGIDGVYAPTRSLAVFCFDATGNPCAGFGGGTGMATSTLGAASSIGRAVGVDGAGRVVAAGVTDFPGSDAAVARFTSTGAADATVNGGLGYRLLGLSGDSNASSLVIDAGNRIVVAGVQAADFMPQTPRQAMAVRLTATGALDATFGVGGRFTTNIGGADNMVSVGLDPGTGGLLLAGSTGPTLGIRSAVTLALTSAGAADPAHGSGGAVIAALSSATSCPASGVALQPDGRMLVAGEATFANGRRPYFARLNLDGTLDASFGSAGVTTLPSAVAASADEIAVAADGSSMGVLTLPQSLVSHVVVHLRADGALDTGFGSAGVASIPSIPEAIYGGLLPLVDGGVLASGRVNDSPGPLVVAKFTAQGAADPAFGAGGASQIPGGTTNFGRDMRVLADGRILVAASVGGSPGLVRLLPTGAPDPTFDGDGVVTLPFMGGGTNLLSAGDDGILLGGSLPNPLGGLLLARFDRDGVPDPAFGIGGVVTDSSAAASSSAGARGTPARRSAPCWRDSCRTARPIRPSAPAGA